jgi:hypothetical protein
MPDILYVLMGHRDFWHRILDSGSLPVIFGWLLFLVMAVVVRSQVATGPASALIMALSTITLLPFLQPRPVIASYVLLTMLVLASLREKLLWTIPLILWIWASVHGSFFLGFVFLGTEWFRTSRSALFKVTAASLVTTSVTAHGVSLWGVILDFAQGRDALSRISEWQPPHLLDLKFLPVFVALVALAVHFSRTGGLTARSGLPLLAWIAFGLTAKRSMPLLWLVMLPLVALAIQTVVASWRSSASMPTAMAYLLTGCMMVVPFGAPTGEALDETRFPLDAARALTSERVFHDDVVGGYLIYAQWPTRLVYVDDRAELYGDRLVQFADARSGGPDWRETLAAAQVEQALVRREDALASLLEESADWLLIYEDHTFLVYDHLGETG